MIKRKKHTKIPKSVVVSNRENLIKLLKFCLVLILASFIFNKYNSGLFEYNFHEDEQHFTRKSYYFDLFFIHPDLTDERWFKYDSPAQPKFGPYIYGVVFHLNGIDDIQQKLQELKFSDYRWVYTLKNRPLTRILYNSYPQLQLIWIARQAAIKFTFMAFLMIFLFTLKTRGLLYATIATMVLSMNPLMLSFGKRAMTDSLQLLGFYGTLLLALLFTHYERFNQEPKLYWLSLGLGSVAAFSVGVKVSGALTIFFLAAFLLLIIAKRTKEKKSISPIIYCALLMSLIFVLIFLPLHPYLYSNPIGNFISMFSERLEWADYMRLADSTTAVYTKFTAVTLVIYRTLMPFGKMANFRTTPLPIDAVLFLSGLWLLGRKASLTWENSKQISGELLLLIWNLIAIGGLIWYLRNDWPRYYLPVVSVITLTEAYAITTIIHLLIKGKVKINTFLHSSLSLTK